MILFLKDERRRLSPRAVLLCRRLPFTVGVRLCFQSPNDDLVPVHIHLLLTHKKKGISDKTEQFLVSFLVRLSHLGNTRGRTVLCVCNCVGCAIDTVRLCGTFVRRTEWKRIRNSDGLEDGRDPFRRHVEVAFLGQKTIDLLFDMGDLRVAELDVPISIGRPGVCENP